MARPLRKHPPTVKPARSASTRRVALNPVLAAAGDFGRSVGDFDRVAPGLHIAGWLRSDALREGRAAIGALVSAYTKAARKGGYFADGRLFSLEGNTPLRPNFDNAIWSITAVLLGGGAGDIDIDAALRLVFGADPISLPFSEALGGGTRPVFPDDGGFPPIPIRDRIPAGRLERLACYGGLRDALTGLGTAATAIGRTVLYPGMTIRGLVPRSGCAGDVIRVNGTGFGARQPADAIVVFGSTRADVVRGSWTDTSFSVTVPAGVSECCVSVLRVPPATGGGAGTLAAAVSELAGVITECFGKTGIAVGSRLEGLANRMPDTEESTCAPDGSNKFIGGPPAIVSFRTNGGAASPQFVVPGQPLELEWSVTNARAVTIAITPKAGNSPLAVAPALPSWFVPNPVSGSLVLTSAPGLVPWKIEATLRATNACGSVSQSLEADYDPALGFIFVGGGMRSCFDLGAVEALALLLPAGPKVCAGTGLGGLSAACTAADWPNPASLRAFWASSTDDSAWFAPNATLLVPGGDYLALNTAQWQMRARAEVLSLDALGLLRSFLVPYRVNDGRELEMIIASVAGRAADKIAGALDTAISTALEEAGQSALSYVPIVAIIWAAAKFAITVLDDSLKQQTANLLAAIPNIFNDSGLRGLLGTATAGLDQRLIASRRRVRIPLASLERGRALYATEGAAVSEAPVGSNIHANSAMSMIVQASATIPMLGAPRLIGADSLVDGSLRDPVPIGATIEAGAGNVIIIQPHVRLVQERPIFAAAGMPKIDSRSSVMRDAQFLDGAIDAFGRFAVDPVSKVPVGNWRVPIHIIEPTVDLIGLGACVGQIGLTNIATDYGYMRAYDAIVPWLLFPRHSQAGNRDAMIAELNASSDRIVGLRVKSWEFEHTLNGLRATPFGPVNRVRPPLVSLPIQESIGDIRATRVEIRTTIVDRLAILGRYEPLAASSVPPGTITAAAVPKPRAEDWVQEWEKYNFYQVVVPSPATPAKPNGDPWVGLGYAGLWTEPAGTRPPMIWV